MKHSLPLLLVWFLLLSVFTLLNTEYLECLGLPFGKGDIHNYMDMFAGDVDIYHALFIAQIRGLSEYTGYTLGEVLAWSIMGKGFFLMPLAYFMYMASLEGDPKRSLYATLLVFLFSWLTYLHIMIGVHAQFEGFFWYLIWNTCYNLKRRGAHDFDLDLVFWGSMLLTILYYPLTIVLFYLHYLVSPGRFTPRLLFLPVLAVVLLYKTPDIWLFLASSKTVSPWTAFMLAPLALLFILLDFISLNDRRGQYIDRDKLLYTAIFILGLFTDNHRLAIYAVPYLYYRATKYFRKKEYIILVLAVAYTIYSFDYHLTQMWYEIVNEGKVGEYCIKKILTRS